MTDDQAVEIWEFGHTQTADNVAGVISGHFDSELTDENRTRRGSSHGSSLVGARRPVVRIDNASRHQLIQLGTDGFQDLFASLLGCHIPQPSDAALRITARAGV